MLDEDCAMLTLDELESLLELLLDSSVDANFGDESFEVGLLDCPLPLLLLPSIYPTPAPMPAPIIAGRSLSIKLPPLAPVPPVVPVDPVGPNSPVAPVVPVGP